PRSVQEATGNKVMIAHGNTLDCTAEESSNRCVAPFDRSAPKLIFKTSALFLLLLGISIFASGLRLAPPSRGGDKETAHENRRSAQRFRVAALTDPVS
ncbi:hypothetical protein ABIB80_007344, partial [Bradyrhizobium sp. i1.15.2]|uniref:hypothetical protein n=1 Tax=Bradyrhizobium sp. i1.15.2 TaxID=3156362 RepID=UPI0033967D18